MSAGEPHFAVTSRPTCRVPTTTAAGSTSSLCTVRSACPSNRSEPIRRGDASSVSWWGFPSSCRCSCSMPPCPCAPPDRATRRPTRSSARTACRATRVRVGRHRRRAIRRSRASRPTSASTRADGRLQDRHHVDQLPDRHLPARLLRRPRRAPGRHDRRPRHHARPTSRPACLDGTTDDNLVDCGNWACRRRGPCRRRRLRDLHRPAVARRRRRRRGSHIVFIVRDDDGGSDLLVQTSDTTWQAYNQYGGYSLYGGPQRTRPQGQLQPAVHDPRHADRGLALQRRVPDGPLARAQRLRRQLLRPTSTRTAHGAEILEHKVFLSSGHDEYWSAGQRANVEAARTPASTSRSSAATRSTGRRAGSQLGRRFGNTDTGRSSPTRKATRRAAPSTGTASATSTATPTRTSGPGCGARTTAGHDGGQPENACPARSAGATTPPPSRSRRPTDAPLLAQHRDRGATTLPRSRAARATSSTGSSPAYASTYPAGRITLSDTTWPARNHQMSLYRAPSGALVFGAGTVQWSWGLDGTHDRGGSTGTRGSSRRPSTCCPTWALQPGTLQAGLVAGGALDATAPTATITSPGHGDTVPAERSRSPAPQPTPAAVVGRGRGVDRRRHDLAAGDGHDRLDLLLQCGRRDRHGPGRAVDDAANIGAPASVSFDVSAQACPCSIFAPSATGTQDNDTSAVELGVKFRSDVDGFITGIRFYKTSGNTGTHTGTLWSSPGTNLGDRHLHRRVGDRLAGGHLRHAGRDRGQHHVRRVVPHDRRALRDRDLVRDCRRRQPAAACPAGRRRRAERRLPVRRGRRLSRPTRFGSSNYLVDVVFVDESGRTRRRRRSRAHARARTRRASPRPPTSRPRSASQVTGVERSDRRAARRVQRARSGHRHLRRGTRRRSSIRRAPSTEHDLHGHA